MTWLMSLVTIISWIENVFLFITSHVTILFHNTLYHIPKLFPITEEHERCTTIENTKCKIKNMKINNMTKNTTDAKKSYVHISCIRRISIFNYDINATA